MYYHVVIYRRARNDWNWGIQEVVVKMKREKEKKKQASRVDRPKEEDVPYETRPKMVVVYFPKDKERKEELKRPGQTTSNKDSSLS
jgi:hypothetical protein